MAQSFTLSSPQKFPTGTVVGAYVEPAPNWIDENPTGAPPGGQAATATVAANGTATFANLADNQRFVAYANVAGVDQYETFSTFGPSGPGQVVGPETITGTETVSGAETIGGVETLQGDLAHTGARVGFYGAAPVTRAAAIGAPSTTGVVTPANAAYTVADQTALANAVLALATAVNSIRAALTNVGITS